MEPDSIKNNILIVGQSAPSTGWKLIALLTDFFLNYLEMH